MNLPILQETLYLLDGSLILTDHQLKITDRNLLQQNIHRLAELSALGKNPQKGAAQYLIRKAALEFGAILSSINDSILRVAEAKSRLLLPFPQ